MGRRRSLVGLLLRDAERSARRAAAEAKRAHAARSRALERELIREERAADRERIRDQRAQERAALRSERDAEKSQKAETKRARLRAWQLEFEEHAQHDADLLSIGNDAPEVEDRTALYAELLQPRPFSPEPYAPPRPSDEELAAASQRHLARLERETTEATFNGITSVQLALGGTLTLGGGLMLLGGAPAFIPLATSGVATLALLSEAVRRHVVASHVAGLRSACDAAVARAEKELYKQADLDGRAAYATTIEAKEAAHQRDEGARIQHLRRLQGGEATAMRRELSEMFPLDLPVGCGVRSTLADATSVDLQLELPTAEVLHEKEARLLASGKVSYKAKTKKRLREEYLRLVAGIALRHAAEAMLLLPTVEVVRVLCMAPLHDASTGTKRPTELLRVTYDFKTLAPLEMENIDPVAALRHFSHQVAEEAEA